LASPFFIGDGGKLAAGIGTMAADIKKPAEAGLKPELLLILFLTGAVGWVNLSRLQ
jgi:hypothetical protein